MLTYDPPASTFQVVGIIGLAEQAQLINPSYASLFLPTRLWIKICPIGLGLLKASPSSTVT